MRLGKVFLPHCCHVHVAFVRLHGAFQNWNVALGESYTCVRHCIVLSVCRETRLDPHGRPLWLVLTTLLVDNSTSSSFENKQLSES